MSKIFKIPALSDTAIDTRIEKNKSIPCYVAGWGYYTEAGKCKTIFYRWFEPTGKSYVHKEANLPPPPYEVKIEICFSPYSSY